LRSGHTPLNEELLVVSSLKFSKFVAYEIAGPMQRPEPKCSPLQKQKNMAFGSVENAFFRRNA